MYNDINIEERIDNYLLDRMSDGERRAFEEDLEKDAELREEYEWQKLIVDAVQRVAMREVLNKIATEKKIKVPEQPRSKLITSDAIRNFFRSKQGVASLVSVAAAVVIIIGSVVNFSVSNTMKISATQLLSQSEPSHTRGGGEIESQIENIYHLIGEGELDSALVSIEDAYRIIVEELSCGANPEEYEYECGIARQYSYNIEWYRTIILMKQGRVLKARRALKVITADPENPYSDLAKNWKRSSKK